MNWEIIQDERNVGNGVVYLKQKGNLYERIIFRRASLIYTTNRSVFESIVEDIKNYCNFFKSYTGEDGTVTYLYQNDICRFGFNLNNQEIKISPQN